MSLKRKLATSAVALSAAAVPFLSTAPAMAMTDPNLDYFNTSVDLSDLAAKVLAAGGCRSTWVDPMLGWAPGKPVVKKVYPEIHVDYSPTITYSFAVMGNTVGYIWCVAS